MTEIINEIKDLGLENKKGGAGMYYPINIDKIKENKENAVFDLKGIDELAENIRKYGLKEALSVYKDGEDNILVAGHRRFNAIKKIFESGGTIMFANKEYRNQIPCNYENKFKDEDEEFFNLAASNFDVRNVSVQEKRRIVERASQGYDRQIEKGNINGKDISRAEYISQNIHMPIRTVYDYLGIDTGEDKAKKLQSVKTIENKLNGFIEFINDIEIEEYGKTDRTAIKDKLNEISTICKKKK